MERGKEGKEHMTKEVMKLAIEALNTPRPSDSYPPLWRTYENTINTAIKALEEALAKQEWVGLTEDDKVLIKHDANYNQFMTAGEYADRVQALTEARLKEKNT